MKAKFIKSLNRREFIIASAALGSTLCLPRIVSAATTGKRTFTILHTNDLHSNLIGMVPATDYTPFSLNDDTTKGGFARLATLIKQQRFFIATLCPAAQNPSADELELPRRPPHT